MIRDFVTGKFENERAKKIIPNIKNILNRGRETGKEIIYVKDSHPEGDHEFDIWGSHAVEGTEGSEIVSGLEPEDDEPVLKKTKYSAFYNTELEKVLKDLDVNKVVLTGVLTHICIQHTAADAFYRGFEIIVPRGCVEDLDDQRNEKALKFIEENYNAEILEWKELLDRW